MNITNKIKVDLQKPGSTPIIYAVQTDSNVRNLEIELFNNRKAFRIPKDVQVIIRYRKFDGSGGEYDTLPDDTPAWHIRKNTLHLALVPQVLASPGSVSITVTLISAGQQISVFPIRLNVDGIASAAIAKAENYFYVTGFLPAPNKAEVGQYLYVSDVTDTGKVAAVEAVNVNPEAGGTVDENTVHAIVDAYLAENPPVTEESDPTVPDWAKQPEKPTYTAQEVGAQPLGEYILKTELPDIISDTLSQAQESGEFDGEDGAPGKSAYAYAQDGGYTGTEEEFAAKLAEDTPKAFYVSVTGDALNGFTSDKTFEEIELAYAAGRALYCLAEVDGLQILHGFATIFSEEEYSAAIFCSPFMSGYVNSVVIEKEAVYVQAEKNTPELKNLSIKIGDHAFVSYDGTAPKTLIVNSLKSPYALSINGTAYDGSVAVDMTSDINALIDSKLGVIENGSY